MGLFQLRIFLVMGFCLPACNKKGADSTATDPSTTAAAVHGATTTTTTTVPSAPPSFDTANLQPGFNSAPGAKETGSDPANVMLRVLHTNYYRPVFLNLLDKPENFAIYQPMPIRQVRTGSSSGQIDSYYIAGHAYSTHLAYPDHTTMMIAYQSDASVLAPPKTYTRIWTEEQTQNYNTLFTQCGALSHTGITDTAATIKCQGLGEAVSSSFGTTAFKYQQLFDILGVFFWKPVPYGGFQCLGNITSNGQGNMPVTELDVNQQFNGLGTSLNPNITVSAMYCVNKSYVSPGKQGEVLVQSADKTLVVYSIVPQDATGFAGGNLFYAQSCPSKVLANCPIAEPVYVLNKQYLIDIGTIGSSN